MQLNIGQKVAYPNQGVCLVEDIERKRIGGNTIDFYFLRVLRDNSAIFVPTLNAEIIGIRPIIGARELKHLTDFLSQDFEEISPDWKIRSREYMEKLQSGDVFEAADVLKKLTYLSRDKKLSFREQTLFEKSKFLVVSEMTNAGVPGEENKITERVEKLVQKACRKHGKMQAKAMSAANH